MINLKKILCLFLLNITLFNPIYTSDTEDTSSWAWLCCCCCFNRNSTSNTSAVSPTGNKINSQAPRPEATKTASISDPKSDTFTHNSRPPFSPLASTGSNLDEYSPPTRENFAPPTSYLEVPKRNSGNHSQDKPLIEFLPHQTS